MNPIVVLLLVVGPFVALVAWWLIESRIEQGSRVTAERNHGRFAKLDRLNVLFGCLLVLGYCVAVFSGFLRPRSTAEGIVVAIGLLGWIIFSTRRSVRESAGADEARQIWEGRMTLVMLAVFGMMLSVAGWLSATHSIR